MSDAQRVTLEQALESARRAEGNTVLVLVSPHQAERLYLALKLADKLVDGDPEISQLVARYAELSGAKTSNIVALTREQYEALLTFAQENGKRWKARLNVAWSTGRYDDYKGTDQYGLLQQIRNTFGPSWLVKFKFNNESTYTRKP